MHKLISGWLQKGLKHLAWLLAAAIAVIVPVAYATDITTTDGYTYDSTKAPAATIVATAASTSITDNDTAAPPTEWHGVVLLTEKGGRSLSLLNPTYSFNSGVFSASQGGLACELV